MPAIPAATGASPAPPFFTIGHSTRQVTELAELLQAAGVRQLVDIRTMPRSRSNPQFNADVLGPALAPWQIDCYHIAELGGLRPKSHRIGADVNGNWRNQSFHNYADYALGAEFRRALARLLELGTHQPTAIMCAEAVWWRCHRRIVADYLLAAGRQVFHILGPGHCEPARLTAGAVVDTDGSVRYPLPLFAGLADSLADTADTATKASA